MAALGIAFIAACGLFNWALVAGAKKRKTGRENAWDDEEQIKYISDWLKHHAAKKQRYTKKDILEL